MNEIIYPTWPGQAQKKYEILMLQELLKNEKIERIVEIGTWKGSNALLFAMMVSRYENGRVYCCDLSFDYGIHYAREHQTNIRRQYRQFYSESPYKKYITELTGDSHDPVFIEKVKEVVGTGSVDLLFIDGDHSYEGVKADFHNFFPLVKSRKYIALHDILDSEYHRAWNVMVAPFWNEIKEHYEWWEFIDNNKYDVWGDGEGAPSKSMGIGVIRK